jgi:hypothetical protein
MEYKSKRLLTIPVLKFVQGQARFVKITGAMHVGKPQKAKEGEKAKEPATLAPTVNLEDGSVCQIIVSSVVKSILTDEYPNDTYVGKFFKITKGERNPGKQYNQFEVEEIEDPTAGEAAVAQHPAAARGGRR